MAGFLYYLPNLPTVNADKVRAAGLGYAIGRGGPTYTTMDPGPDKGSGVVFSLAGTSGTELLPQGADDVTWEQIPGSEAWLGYDPENRPRPEDLAREKQYDGHQVRLGDGNEWLVPVARYADESTPLPRKLEWTGSGWVQGEIREQYREIFAQACRVWDAFTTAEKGIVFVEECDLAAMALGLHYRIGPAEISALGLFDSATEAAVVKAVIDWPFVQDLGKKAQRGELSLPPGSED